jgi:hypothetical protein
MAVAAVVILPAWAPGASARPAAAPASQTAFIEALSAIPAAVEALAAAREGLTASQARQATARAVATARATEYAMSSDSLHERILVRTRAELAAARAQESVDDVARQMYASGGGVPSLVDVMLTSQSEDGLMRSLVTRQYLSSAAGDRMQAGQFAVDEAARAEAARTAAAQAWASASADWDIAAGGLVEANRETMAARAALRKANVEYRRLMDITSADHSADYGKVKKCGDWLTRLLAKTGFSGENLREAWAIVMRESGGREDAVSVSNDLGLFQINTATWKGQPWFDRKALLKRKYNAKVGYLLSQGGDSWYSWGLDGHGRPDAGAYVRSGWSQKRIVAKIIEPYVLWYSLYPCRPSYERDTWLGLPIDIAQASKPRAEDTGEEPLSTGGGGQLPSMAPAPPSALPSDVPTAIPTGPPPLDSASPEPTPSSEPVPVQETPAPTTDPVSPSPTSP